MYRTSASLAPRKGLAAELARESERLKRGTSEGLPKVVARNCRRREAENSEAGLSLEAATMSTSSLHQQDSNADVSAYDGTKSVGGTETLAGRVGTRKRCQRVYN